MVELLIVASLEPCFGTVFHILCVKILISQKPHIETTTLRVSEIFLGCENMMFFEDSSLHNRWGGG